jgi:hypothetical protein
MTIANVKTALTASMLWLLANVVGICLYLIFQFWLLAPRSEGEALNGIDEKFYWICAGLPILIFFLILNSIWLRLIVMHGRSGGSWLALSVWLLMCAGWLVDVFGFNDIGLVMLNIFADMVDGRAWK